MMQADTPSAFFFKLWPWIEANLKRIAWGAGILVVAAGCVAWYFWWQNQKEIAAANALTQASMTAPAETNGDEAANAYLNVAKNYPGTMAGARALLEAATQLFTEGKYPEAQTQFQNFLNDYPDNTFAAQASLGVAACLDAQGKTDAAISAYKNVISQSPSDDVFAQAKFSLARIYNAQGRVEDAYDFYEDVAHADPYGLLGREAAMRAAELKLPGEPAANSPSTTNSTPAGSSNNFQLLHINPPAAK
jgi:predicted negative regulator of RcsB-dependent stress response